MFQKVRFRKGPNGQNEHLRAVLFAGAASLARVKYRNGEAFLCEAADETLLGEIRSGPYRGGISRPGFLTALYGETEKISLYNGQKNVTG